MRGATRNLRRGVAGLAWASGISTHVLRCESCSALRRCTPALLLAVPLIAGCARRESVDVKSASPPVPTTSVVSVTVSPAAVGPARVAPTVSACRAGCDRATRGTFAAWLGFDPADGEKLFASTTNAELLAKIQALAATKGRKVVARPLGEFLAAQDKTPHEPAVFVSSQGHYFLFVGMINAGKEPEYEVVHGHFDAGLQSRRRLEGVEHVDQVWTLAPAAIAGIPIRCGEGEVTVSKLVHNFGEIRPGRKYEVAISMKNSGKRTIVLKKPHTTCGCTKPQYQSKAKLKPGQLPEELLPGETTEMMVGVSLKPVAAVYLPVTPVLVDKESGAEREFEVQLVAFQRQTMEVAPKTLDFGTFTVGSRLATRVLRLVEVPSDRFRLKRIDVGTVPVTQRITEEKSEAGLSTYRVEFALDPNKTEPGTHAGDITVVTDSDVQPTRVVPVSWRKKGRVEVVPPVLTFGAVRQQDTGAALDSGWRQGDVRRESFRRSRSRVSDGRRKRGVLPRRSADIY
jgi:hypothetical protein